MRRCKQCGSNLLDSTLECPVCNLPSETAAAVKSGIDIGPPRGIDRRSKFFLWFMVGVMFPPLGLVMLIVYLLSPSEPKSK
jgi:hypothetical protein